MTTNRHLRFSASKLDRILACPGSVSLYEQCGITDDHSDTEVSIRGDKLHAITAEILMALHHDNYTPNEKQLLTRLKSYDLDLNDYAAVAANLRYFVSTILVQGSMPIEVHIERQYSISDLPECGGTADVVIVNHGASTITVIDWKYGEGIEVFPIGNTQLLCYGVAVQDTLNLRDYALKLHIAQPAFDKYEEWIPTGKEIADFHTIIYEVLRSVDADSERVSGSKQCFWCDVSPQCPEFVGQLKSAMEEALTVDINTVSTEELVELSDNFSLAKTAMKRIDDYLTSKMKRGDKVPGKKLVHGRASRRWKDERQAIAFLASKLDDDQLYNMKPVTPPQAEKLCKGFKKDPEFHKLVEKVPGKPLMVPEADRRKAINFQNSAKEAFKDFI